MRILAVSTVATLVLLAGCKVDNSHYLTPSQMVPHYGTKSVYHPHQEWQTYEAAPAGFTPLYTELVARHGSRALSSLKYDDLTLQVWQAAQAQGALTELGKQLGPEVERLMAANAKLGYGNLSQLGQEEHTQLAERLAARHLSLFNSAAAANRHVAIEHSGKDRAVDSAANFAESLKKAVPTLAPLVDKAIKNPDQLYFHKADANADYQAYVESDPRLLAAIDGLNKQPESRKLAREMLERLYSKSFVDKLANGDYTFVDNGKGETTVRNEVDAALMLFNLYLIAPGLKYEAGDTQWQFDKFVTTKESEWFAYLLDGEDFYQKGPSFADETITYRMAKVLVDDFFKEVEGLRDGSNSKVAKLRFAHAETIIPFAAQMQLQGSTQGVARDQLYSQANNPWRGEWVSPYSANIQWDVYRDSSGTLLVKMLYNEQESRFKSDCQPVKTGSYYYNFDELKRCYGE
ncbi:MAG: histidine-type phosphatase [Aeromonadaceae bacterium]